MKFKLDENFGTRLQALFAISGHDVSTIRQQRMQGSTDNLVFETCAREKRILITLDLDFSNILRFPPEKSAGVIIFRMPDNPTLSALEKMAKELLAAFDNQSPENRLWIVETGRIRIHDS
jgi:predicted nuclease of predicted toxin-antitoxin system